MDGSLPGGSEEIGEKIRLRRKVRGLSLREVAQAAQISIGQLSQVERGLSAPSLRALGQICKALNMPIGWLFRDEGEPEPDNGAVVRNGQWRVLDFGPKRMIKHLLTNDTCRDLQMMRVIVYPQGDSDLYVTKGNMECGTVQEGVLGLQIEDSSTIVRTGETFTIQGHRNVRFWCVGDARVVVIWVSTPAIY
ncbi:MAG: helix-turn-helix domain-containing protein [Acetobacter sp.]|uniref:helix-turn-helix domain-containing protein n=1 Tax=Acetobacter sp. TaxID=440 RepID=UPI003D01BCC5